MPWVWRWWPVWYREAGLFTAHPGSGPQSALGRGRRGFLLPFGLFFFLVLLFSGGFIQMF